MTINLTDPLPGHWLAKDGYEMAMRYAPMKREELCGGAYSDMLVAFEIASLRRDDQFFEPTLAAARDRIRWLSVQLALADARNAEMRGLMSNAVQDAAQFLIAKGHKDTASFAAVQVVDLLCEYAARPTMDDKTLQELQGQAWTDLCDVDDRTSPADYPDHCLITQGELARFMARVRDGGAE